MEEVFINQEADPYVLEVDGRLDLSALELQPASIVINSKKSLVDAQTSKTKRTFMDIQQKVLHDGTAGSKANPLIVSGTHVAGAAQRDPLVHCTHSGLHDAFSCVSPVVYKEQSIGSVARISGNGLMVSSNHIFVEKGKFLKTMAFGGHPLELVVSFPYLDIILLKGPKGPAFRLPSQNLLPGLPVMMLGFPKVSITDIKGLDSPVAAKGHINAIPISMEVALADYHGAMPASSGAPVLFDTCTIAGVHTGALFHLDDEYIKTDHYEDAPRSRIDKDEQDMWWPQAGFNAAAASHSPKRKASTTEWDQAVKGIEKMALHVNANIPHKDQLATFVPWQSIHFAAHLAGEMPGSAYHVPTSSRMGLKLQS